MTRVSSFGHNQGMVQQLLQNQSRLYDTQTQINTGKKTDEFRGLARQAQTLLGAKSVQTRNDGYLSALQDAQRKLDSNELYLETIRSAGNELRQALTETLGQDEAISFSATLEQAASVILGALNSQLDGRYLFAGSRTDTKPVAADGIADLLSAPSVASLFSNDSMKLSSRVGDTIELTYGVLADEVGQDILTSLKALADFNASGAGPLDGKLTTAQRTFLETEMTNLIASIDKVQNFVAENGLQQNRAETYKGNIETSTDFLAVFISDIEDVNMAEAVTRINADQLALQVSYSVVGRLSQMSLLNYL